jgi:dolichyl-phosphate-mannose--protein O-mannosyl transferase
MKQVPQINFTFFAILIGFTLSAFAMRFYHLDQPREVVFDEYHFFYFVMDYEKGEYFFDIHPPLGKLLLWGNAKLYGINQFADKTIKAKKRQQQAIQQETIFSEKIKQFETNSLSAQEIASFRKQYQDLYNKHLNQQSTPTETKKIGAQYDEYLNVFGIRSLPAFFGALLIPVVFLGIFFLTGSVWGASLSSLFFLFEPSFLVESRFVLLNSMLLFFIIAGFFSCLFYIKHPSWKCWWAVIITTSFAASIKWTGFSTIGLAGIVLLVSSIQTQQW